MTAAIEMKAYVVGGLVSAQTVTDLLRFGEPMVTEHVCGDWCNCGRREYRAWIRLRGGGRVMGHPWHSTPQLAAENLLAKLRGAW